MEGQIKIAGIVKESIVDFFGPGIRVCSISPKAVSTIV